LWIDICFAASFEGEKDLDEELTKRTRPSFICS